MKKERKNESPQWANKRAVVKQTIAAFLLVSNSIGGQFVVLLNFNQISIADTRGNWKKVKNKIENEKQKSASKY